MQCESLVNAVPKHDLLCPFNTALIVSMRTSTTTRGPLPKDTWEIRTELGMFAEDSARKVKKKAVPVLTTTAAPSVDQLTPVV
jgi:hypothetical protein